MANMMEKIVDYKDRKPRVKAPRVLAALLITATDHTEVASLSGYTSALHQPFVEVRVSFFGAQR
jgi:hypothetical protein